MNMKIPSINWHYVPGISFHLHPSSFILSLSAIHRKGLVIRQERELDK